MGNAPSLEDGVAIQGMPDWGKTMPDLTQGTKHIVAHRACALLCDVSYGVFDDT